MSRSGRSPREPLFAIWTWTRLWQRLLPWLITALCFTYLYRRLDQVAAAEGNALIPYLAAIFRNVRWSHWLALMVPYCLLFLVVDSLIVWRVVTWFNAKLGYAEILSIRASAYILSIVNEQVSKGAIALYLRRRRGVPGWEVASSMLFIMLCEYYYLLMWATIGVLWQWERFPPVFHAIPPLAIASVAFFGVFHLFFSGRLWPGTRLRERPIFRSFRMAKVWHYAAVIALHSPLMLISVVVYTRALGLFGVGASYGEILGYLPVIFFGAATPGPMHSVAILLWVVSFPDRPGEMTVFGFVQHNFFIFFNAALGVLFLRRATRAVFEKAS
jgi:hypothetical protein